jgi:hypothetical protein
MRWCEYVTVALVFATVAVINDLTRFTDETATPRRVSSRDVGRRYWQLLMRRKAPEWGGMLLTVKLSSAFVVVCSQMFRTVQPLSFPDWNINVESKEGGMRCFRTIEPTALAAWSRRNKSCGLTVEPGHVLERDFHINGRAQRAVEQQHGCATVGHRFVPDFGRVGKLGAYEMTGTHG